MAYKPSIHERLKKALSLVIDQDPKLAVELNDKRSSAAFKETAESIREFITTDNNLESFTNDDFGEEAVILRVGRPVLIINNSEATLEFEDAESEIWRERLTNAKSQLALSIPAVGRIELQNHHSLDWCGTGWFIDGDIVVTNRHVAEIFGRNNGAGFIFRQGIDGNPLSSSIDLLEEFGRPDEKILKLVKILHIETEPGPDLAFIRVEPLSDNLPTPIVLDTVPITGNPEVVVIGYPAKDSRMPDVDLMEKIFGNVFEKKRLAPGQIKGANEKQLFHDCSTLGGCSGSAVIDLKTGKAVGLHFAGRFMEANYAVPAALLAQKLDAVKNKRTLVQVPGNERNTAEEQDGSQSINDGNGNSFTFNIPLQVSVSLNNGQLSVNTVMDK